MLTEAEGIVTSTNVVKSWPSWSKTFFSRMVRLFSPLWRIVQTGFDRKVKGFRMHPTQYIFLDELAVEKV